jgi:hypothetical protein
MSCKLIRRFQKKEQDTWGGITFNMQRAFDKTPDPRDSQFNQFVEVKDLVWDLNYEIRSTFQGFLGYDRKHVSDNVLEIIFHFDDVESAIEYKNMYYSSNTVAKRFSDTIKEKQNSGSFPVYTVTNMIVDDAGNIVNT